MHPALRLHLQRPWNSWNWWGISPCTILLSTDLWKWLSFTTLVPICNACARLWALEDGGCCSWTEEYSYWLSWKHVCQSSLVDMYHNVEALEDAPRVFNKMRSCNVVIWAEWYTGTCKTMESPKAMELFEQIQSEHVQWDPVTFSGYRMNVPLYWHC